VKVGKSREKPAWVDEFEKAFWSYLTRAGEYQVGVVPQDFQEDAFTWCEPKASEKFRQHMERCEVDLDETAMPDDCYWEEFGGTFSDNDVVHGLQAHVTCRCRNQRMVKVRYRGTLSDLILGVMNAAGLR
jgi:hypothetical protein